MTTPPYSFSKIRGLVPEVMRHHLGWLAIEIARSITSIDQSGKHEFNVVFEVDFDKAHESNKALMTDALAVVSTRRLPEPDDEVDVKLTRRQIRMLQAMASHSANKADKYRRTSTGVDKINHDRQFVVMQDIAIRLDTAEAEYADKKGE